MTLKADRKFKSTGKRKITSIFLILVVLSFLLISTCFIAYEADHDCTGEDCPVCALIQMSENNLRQLGSGAPVAAAAVSLCILVLAMQIRKNHRTAFSTPVSCKIRLNN